MISDRKFFTHKDFPVGTLIAFDREHTVFSLTGVISPSPKYTTVGLVVGHPHKDNINIEWISNSWHFPFKEGSTSWLHIRHDILQDAIIQKPE
jgi:hypothetical protein